MMVFEQMPIRQRRILALVILIGLIALAYSVLVMPLLALANSYDERITSLSLRLVSSRKVLGDGMKAKEQLRQLAMAEKRGGYYLENDKSTLAAAELQRRVKQTIEQHGGSIISSQILGEQEEGDLQKVVLRVNMRMGLQTFEKILYALETQPPVLVLDNVTIVARPSGSTARWRGATEMQELDASLDVMGYKRLTSASDT